MSDTSINNTGIIEELSEQGIDFARIIDAKNEDIINFYCQKYPNLRYYVCSRAAVTGNIDVLKRFINDDIDVSYQAAQNNHINIIKFLINNERKIDDSIIDYAVKYNRVRMLKLLLGVSKTCTCENIDIIIKKNNIEIIKVLLDAGVNVTQTCVVAIIERGCKEMVNLILDYTKKTDDPHCDEVFSAAIRKGYNEIVEKLLNIGFIPNSGHTLLSVKKNNMSMLRLLIKYSVDCSDVFEYATKTNGVEIIKVLIETGGLPAPENIYTALARGGFELIKIINEIKPYPISAIYVAEEQGYHDIYEYLVEKNKDKFMRDMIEKLSSYGTVININ